MLLDKTILQDLRLSEKTSLGQVLISRVGKDDGNNSSVEIKALPANISDDLETLTSKEKDFMNKYTNELKPHQEARDQRRDEINQRIQSIGDKIRAAYQEKQQKEAERIAEEYARMVGEKEREEAERQKKLREE